MNTESNLGKTLEYVECVLRAHHEAGLTIEAKHFYQVRNILCGVSNATPLMSLTLDTSLATEPASCVAKRLLKT